MMHLAQVVCAASPWGQRFTAMLRNVCTTPCRGGVILITTGSRGDIHPRLLKNNNAGTKFLPVFI